jgi:methionyl-tRNA formyltransferase
MFGDAETGICIMQMEAGLDTGPVLLREATPIGEAETTADLHDRLASIGAGLIVTALDGLDQLVPEPQPEAGVTYASKIDKAEAAIDWTRPAVEVDRQIRGLSPFPGAWTTLNGKRVKLLRSRRAKGGGAPGAVLEGFIVACGTGAVEVTEAQIEGRERQGVNAFLNGTPLPPGTILGG